MLGNLRHDLVTLDDWERIRRTRFPTRAMSCFSIKVVQGTKQRRVGVHNKGDICVS